MKKSIALAGALTCASAIALEALGAAAPFRVTRLRCEYRDTPLGVDDAVPRLSWVLESNVRGQRQTAYRVLAAANPDDLARERGTLWDTGKVSANRQLHIEYQGKPLSSGQRVHWKVMAWDKDGTASAWSAPSWWEMGLLKKEDWRGTWISDGQPLPDKEEDFYRDDPAPLFRKAFSLSGPVRRARLYITGLGYVQASLNGNVIADEHLEPLWTRPDKRVLYAVHDATEALAEGTNALGVTLGNGWYNPLPLRMWGRKNLREHLPTGRPRFIAQLDIEYADGSLTSVVSDTTWTWTPGPMLRNSIYLGEKIDARIDVGHWDRPGFDDGAWRPAAVAEEPGGRLQARPLEPVRVTKTLKTVRVTEPAPGVYIADLGQNFGGWVRCTFDVPAGTRIVMRYGELLHPDGSLNPMTSVCGQIKGEPTVPDHPGPPGVAWQTDTYIARGGGLETYTPRFTFHAFRYVEFTGLPVAPSPENVEGLRMSCDVEPVGSFSCSNDLFNRIQRLCDWTFLSNLFGVQSDCPHRERFGYGGDLVTTSDAFLLNYDMAGFYAKVARDWADSALEDGMLTDTAPYVGIQYCGVGWAMAHPLLQEQLYRYYGDRRIVEDQYAVSRRWFERVRSTVPDFILTRGLHDHECLEGEKAPPMVTPLYAESARILSRLAHILGKTADAENYRELAGQIKTAYADRFLNKGTGAVASGIQSAQAFALAMQMLPEAERAAALEHLVKDVEEKHNGHLTTGIFGTKFMLEVLSRMGRVETAYRVVDQLDFPGWGHMLDQGATTLWEHWKFNDNTFSHNHPMFGSVSQWFYNWLGGIEPAPDAEGFDRVLLHPRFVRGLDWVKCSVSTVRGPVVCEWKRRDGRIDLSVRIPVNASAELSLPGAAPDALTENGRPAAEADGVEILAGEPAAWRLGPGTYQFTLHP